MPAAPKPVRVVLLLEDLDFGGTQRYAVNLVSHLDRARIDPAIWTLRGGTDFRPAIDAAGVPVIDLTRTKKVGAGAILRLASKLWRERPDVLYTLTVLPNIWGRLFAGLLGIAVVSGYRNHRPGQHEWLLARFSKRIIANAERLKDELTTRFAIPAEKITVIPNGVDTDHFAPPGETSVTGKNILCVARRVGRKDLPTLLEALAILRRTKPDARLKILGNGPIALDAGDNVEILDATPDIRPHLAAAGIFVLSSIDEGAPNAILEAMAAGLPVVTTATGGTAEIVRDGETGRVVPPRDPQALADALAELMADPARAKAMGTAGRARVVRDFSLAVMVTETAKVLEEVTGRRGGN